MSVPVLKELIKNQSYIQGRENATESMTFSSIQKKTHRRREEITKLGYSDKLSEGETQEVLKFSLSDSERKKKLVKGTRSSPVRATISGHQRI